MKLPLSSILRCIAPTALVAALGFAACAHAQQIAITFDDLPEHSALPPDTTRMEIAQAILKAFKEEGVPPTYGFVNANHLVDHPEEGVILDAWRAAGNPLGNHTWSHLNLNQHTVEEWGAEVLQDEPAISSRMAGQDWHWLRYPNLAEGATPEQRAAARAFLAQHGYKVAAVTMSFADYSFNEPYARCVAKHDTAAIQQLEDAYLLAASETADRERTLSKALYGHDIPYVLLMHIGGLDARLISRLLKLYKSKGFTFVSLVDAEKDPFYKPYIDLTLPAGPTSLESAAVAQHIPLPPRGTPLPPFNTMCK